MVLSKSKKTGINLKELVNEKVYNKKSNELLIVVPTNRKSRQLRKSLLKLSPSKALDNVFVETLTTISQEILFSSGFSFTFPSESVSSVLLEQSFKEILNPESKTEIRYFFIFRDGIPKGSLDKIKAAISEYKRHGISPEMLEKELSEVKGIDANKAYDIINVYKLLNTKYRTLNLKDTGDIYSDFLSLSSEKLKESFRKLFPDVNLLIVQDFSDFSYPEIRIINMLADIQGIDLLLDIDYNYKNPHLFSHLADRIDELNEMGFHEAQVNNSDDNSIKKYISENLFNYTGNRSGLHRSIQSQDTKHRSFFNDIDNWTLFTAENKTEEVTLIAKEIKDLLSSKEIPPHSIGVVFNLIQDYSAIIRDVFPSYGIPYNLTDRHNLSTFSPVTTIISLLEIIESDFYYKSLFRVLSNELVRLQGIDINDIMSTASELRIISGYKNWIKNCEKQIEILKKEGIESERYIHNHEIELYENIKKQITYLYDLLTPFLFEMTPENFYQSLEKLITDINLPFAELKKNYPIIDAHRNVSLGKSWQSGSAVITGWIGRNMETAEINLKALESFLSTIKELFTLFSYEYPKEKTFKLSFYLENIRTAVASTRFNLKEKSNFGVQITTFEEIRGLEFDYLFIAGLYDDNIPTKDNPEVFTMKKFVKGELKHSRMERYLFYKVVTSFTKRVYFSYPTNDDEKELIPSIFLKELSAISGQQSEIKYRELEKNPKEIKIHSIFELKTEMGRNEGLRKTLQSDNKSQDHSVLEGQLFIDSKRVAGESYEISSYTGIIENDKNGRVRSSLSTAYTRNYSISQLETYAKCPFKFFIERVLNISKVEEPSEEIESMEMGDLLHRSFYHFSVKLKAMGIVLYNCTDNDFETAKSLLFKTAKEIFKEFEFNSESDFFEFEKVFGIKGNESNSILSKFLQFERNNELNEVFTPELFEVPFGKLKDEEGQDSTLYDFSFEGIKLRGKIDRIDIGKEYHVFRVIDYKLGKKSPSRDHIEKGIDLQLPVYLYAAKRILAKKYSNLILEPALAGLYSLRLKHSEFGFNPISVDNSRTSTYNRVTEKKTDLVNFHNSLIDRTLGKIKEYVTGISEGKYPLSSLPDRESFVCKYCSFITVCRKDEVITTYSSEEE